jgi:hypothetical protein
LVSSSVERRYARKYNIGNDAHGPNITLRAIVFSKNLRSNIIRSTQFFVEFFTFIVNERGTEVYNFYLIEFLGLFQKDVFWFEVTMDNMILVAVVYTRKYLFYQHRCIIFSELSSGYNLIE